MTSSGATWPRVERLFHEAVTLDPEARRRFLDQHCPTGDPGHDQLVELLSADRGVTSTWSSLEMPPPSDIPSIPGYRDLTLLGQGGMGTVYRGHRHDDLFDGKAFAIKVLHHHRTDVGGMRRFDTERRLLADLDHPSIVSIHDAGVLPDARPYLVMDYVDGRPLDRYCNQERLDVDARLALFRDICMTVHHAHQRQVIHRDLKPSNIVVDHAGMPHLLDFGIAKRLRAHDEATAMTTGDNAPLTAPGHAPMTKAYASPEQVLGRPVTTASDLYTLGVILCELLTDQRPVPPERHDHDAPDPPAPSQLLPETDSQATHDRRTTVGRLKRRLRSDLDHIARKALRADPAARYASARELADDVGRHLAGHPVLARRGGWRYVAGRFAWRHRTRLVIATSLALVVGFATTAASQSKRRIAAEHQAAENDRLVRLMAGPEAESILIDGIDDTVREILDLRIPAKSKRTLIDVIRRLRISDDQLLEQLLEQLEDQLGPGLVTKSAQRSLAPIVLQIGQRYYHDSQFEAAEAVLRWTLDLTEAGDGDEVETRAMALDALGRTLSELERFDGGIHTLRAAIRLRQSHPGHHADVARSMAYLAGLHYRQGQFSDSESVARRALALLETEDGGPPSLRGRLLSSRAIALIELDTHSAPDQALVNATEALALHVAELGPGHLRTLESRSNLTKVLYRTGDVMGALLVAKENLMRAESTLGSDHPRLANILTGLATGYHELGQLETCIGYARRAVDLRRSQLPAGDWLTAFSEKRLAACLGQAGQYDEALALLQTSIHAFQQSTVSDDTALAEAQALFDKFFARQVATSRAPRG